MQFADAVTAAGTRRTGDGTLVAEAKAVRTGIQLYLGDEVGRWSGYIALPTRSSQTRRSRPHGTRPFRSVVDDTHACYCQYQD